MPVVLNDGRTMPELGLGVWPLSSAQAADVAAAALRLGYRSIDTAANYDNEEGVGAGIRAAGIDRRELFVTTKLRAEVQGYDPALHALEGSLRRLGLDEVDLYLIHWPAAHESVRIATWRALIRMRDEGRARSIGVSNFTRLHLEQLIEATGVAPAVNQLELHPRLQQRALRQFHIHHGIATESWSPLARGQVLDDPTVAALALKHGRSPAQIVLRWHLDNGLIAIPRTRSVARLKENLEVSSFRLEPDDLLRMAALDDPRGRIGPDPDWV